MSTYHSLACFIFHAIAYCFLCKSRFCCFSNRLLSKVMFFPFSIHAFLNRNLELFFNVRSNMKQRLMSLTDKILLRKRSVIETVNDHLKKHFSS